MKKKIFQMKTERKITDFQEEDYFTYFLNSRKKMTLNVSEDHLKITKM